MIERRLERYPEPVPDPSTPYGWRYAFRPALAPPAMVASRAIPSARVAVADCFPDAR